MSSFFFFSLSVSGQNLGSSHQLASRLRTLPKRLEVTFSHVDAFQTTWLSFDPQATSHTCFSVVALVLLLRNGSFPARSFLEGALFEVVCLCFYSDVSCGPSVQH